MVTFFLLGKKGLEVLNLLDQKSIENIDMLVIGTDKNVQKDYSEDIRQRCLGYGVPHVTSNKTSSFSSKYAIAIGWRRLINCEETQRLIVLHDSILPRLRGFNPLVTALINGDKEIGVTALFASEEYDRGEIIDSEVIQISYPIKIEEAIARVSVCYSILVNRLMKSIYSQESLEGRKQDESKATYSLWRDKEDYFINWEDDADKISRHIDAVGFPYDGAKTHYDNRVITILEATPLQEDVYIENRIPGKVIFKKDGYLVVVCGRGLLIIRKALDTDKEYLDFNGKFRLRFK